MKDKQHNEAPEDKNQNKIIKKQTMQLMQDFITERFINCFYCLYHQPLHPKKSQYYNIILKKKKKNSLQRQKPRRTAPVCPSMYGKRKETEKMGERSFENWIKLYREEKEKKIIFQFLTL